MRQVQKILIVGIRVNRRHPSFSDDKFLVNDFRQRRQAVRRARRIRDDLVLRRIVLLVVHAEDERDIRTFRGRRDDDLLRAGGDVFGGGAAIGEQARRLEDDIDAERFPRQLAGVALRQDFELVAVDRDAVLRGVDARVKVAEHRVVLEQMRERMRAREIVDGGEVDVRVAQRGPHDVPPDAAESVDPDPYSHRSPPDKRFILQ